MSVARVLAASSVTCLTLACRPSAPVATLPAGMAPLPAPVIAADSAREVAIAPGVMHRYYWMSEGPWAVHVLDVDRAYCWSLAAAKGARGAAGRSATSRILAERRDAGEAVAAVNADFFLFEPPGVPQGPHVEDGRVIAGPGRRPAVYLDSAGAIVLDTLRTTGWLTGPRFGTEISGWNRPLPRGLSVFDGGWGAATDSATGAIEVVVESRGGGAVLAVDTLPAGVAIPAGGAVIALGPGAPAVTRIRLLALKPGVDSLRMAVALAPVHPVEAVGGFPLLLRDGSVVDGLASAGGERFGPFRHPRTALGIGAGGRRVVLVVVDGRQPPYSDGMTLPELATLMQALGADEAINLDGGGSSTMAAIPGGRGDAIRVLNRPSDAAGERAVANALVVRRGRCFGR